MSARPDGRRHRRSGFSVPVVDTAPASLHEQVAEAVAFLDRFAADIRELQATGTVEDIRLDFPVKARAGREVAAQFELFPAELVRKAGALGIALEISLYPSDDEL